MKQILKAFLALGRRGQHNVVKIVCLGVALAAGVVLVGKVAFEGSFDSFFPTSQRTYVVSETIVREGEYKEYPQCAGAIAPGLRRYCPQVEAATRFTRVFDDFRIVTDDNHRLRANVVLVDSCFFDVFPFRVLAGDPKEVLSRTDYCMIPRSMMEKLSSASGKRALAEVIGMKIYLNDTESLPLTVGGVFEDIPLNSMLNDLDVLLAMPTITRLTWDGRDNWVGNDRYRSFVRLAEGTQPEALKPLWQKMMRENVDVEELSEAGVEMGFTFTPITQFNTKDPAHRRMMWILSILAFVLIFCAVMNYLLIVVGSITGRAKEMAVHKCYGAQRHNIYTMVMAEAVVHLLLAMLLAGALLYLFRDVAEHLTGAPLLSLVAVSWRWLSLVALLVLLVTGLVPSWLYARVPVAVAFRRYRQSHRHWKLVLLGVQFACACFLLTLLGIINRQYQLMVNDEPGYEYRDMAVYHRRELNTQQKQLLIEELRKLSSVKSVTTSTVVLADFQSGDNITLPDDPREYMNVADLYFTGDGFLQALDIPVVAGRTFTEGSDSISEVMVSQRFEQRMKQLAGWDTALGQQVHCSSFGGIALTIVGIYPDIRLGSIAQADERPSIMFYRKTPDVQMPVVWVRFHHRTAEALQEANRRIQELLPTSDVVLEPYTNLITQLYNDSRSFRQMVLIGGLVTLVIALIALIGYMAGEVSRRQKEIAIRKVNGARIREVLALFLRDVLRVAVPAVVVGALAAFFVARLWLQQFSEQAPLVPWLFLVGALAVLAVVLGVVALGCWRVAVGNPVRYLKSE